LGSAYGQGDSVGSFSASSIGQSTIALSGTGIFEPFVLLGQITPGGAAAVKPAVSPMLTTKAPDGVTTNTFAGVVDADEDGTVLAGKPFTGGGITMATDGRGSLTIPAGDALDASKMGVYLIDPHLNPNDPNNPSTATLSSALLVDLDNDVNTISLGVSVPQTSPSTTDFTGNYAFGGQVNFFSTGDEVDFVGQGNVTSLALSGSGLFNDLFGDITGRGRDTQTPATFTATLSSDTINTNAGRYTTDLVVVLAATGQTVHLAVAVYQASGTQLFWIEEGNVTRNELFMGQLQQQNLPAE
jgi:hypothetical protein